MSKTSDWDIQQHNELETKVEKTWKEETAILFTLLGFGALLGYGAGFLLGLILNAKAI
jgi:hypothetical protein